jgi:uncharacterized protein (DUF433 family)
MTVRPPRDSRAALSRSSSRSISEPACSEGLSPEEIVEDYPPLTVEDVRAVIAYAAALARGQEFVSLR